MPIKRLRNADAYFVIDAFSYRTHIQEYDPLATNQTLISFGEDGGLAVLEDEPAEFLGGPEEFSEGQVVIETNDDPDEMDAQAELEKITPRNAELLCLAERLPAPQEWYDE